MYTWYEYEERGELWISFLDGARNELLLVYTAETVIFVRRVGRILVYRVCLFSFSSVISGSLFRMPWDNI